LVELLLTKGADINGKSNEDVTPLYTAVKFDRAEIAKLLIARGATVDARTKNGYTPLIQAAHRGNMDIVELLIVHGADVDANDNTGNTALVWSVRTATLVSPSGQGLLSSKLSPLTDTEQTQFRKDLQGLKGQWREVARLLIERGTDVNATASGEDYPLYLAASMGDKDLVEALIAKGAKLNPAISFESPLHSAIAEKHKDVAELLINRGANVNARNVNDRTPLHFLAAFMNDRNLAELMIAHGADINAIDKNGATPLGYATKLRNEQVVEVLRRRGGK
jgi:ankyrin repeat protein